MYYVQDSYSSSLITARQLDMNCFGILGDICPWLRNGHRLIVVLFLNHSRILGERPKMCQTFDLILTILTNLSDQIKTCETKINDRFFFSLGSVFPILVAFLRYEGCRVFLSPQTFCVSHG